MDEPFTGYGLLAEDIALAKDKLSVTFRLNSKARFSNGQPVTAKDVKFSFDTLMSEQAHPQYRFYYADVKQAGLPDLSAAEQQGFEMLLQDELSYSIALRGQAQIADLLLMTPHMFRAGQEGKQRAAALDQIDLTVDVSLRLLQLND